MTFGRKVQSFWVMQTSTCSFLVCAVLYCNQLQLNWPIPVSPAFLPQ